MELQTTRPHLQAHPGLPCAPQSTLPSPSCCLGVSGAYIRFISGVYRVYIGFYRGYVGFYRGYIRFYRGYIGLYRGYTGFCRGYKRGYMA